MRFLPAILGTAAMAAALLAACSDEPEPPPRTVAPSPTEGVDSTALAALLVEHWDLEVAIDPMWGTYVGDHRGDARLMPVARADVEALQARRRDLLGRVTALDPAGLSARDRTTHAILLERLTADAGLDACQYGRWAISTRRTTVGRFYRIGEWHPLLAAEDSASYRARVEAMPATIDAFAGELAAGAADGLTSDRQAVRDVIGLLRAWAATPPADWPMVAAVRNGYLPADERDRLAGDVTAMIARAVAPAYQRMASTLESRVLPVARQVEGLAGLPLSPECYAAEIRRHTTLPLTAADLHALGLAEVARVEAAMVALGSQLYGVDTLAAITDRLDADAGQHFRSEAEIVTWVKGIIAHAREQVAPLFASFPKAPLEVMPYAADVGQIAASYSASPNGVSPARYYLVTQPPEWQSKWALESTTYHEAIPGHHLQVGRAVELAALPALRRALEDTAYVEGWGLYAETLAGEIGLFTDGPGRLGRLANESLRACRLVIDTGLHDLGWTRAEAIAYMEQHSPFGGPYVVGEIERYVAGPGQALAYKVGELELLRLRAAVQARDGAAFSLRDFHEAVLGEGSLPLRVLDERILGAPVSALQAWIGELPEHGTGAVVERTAGPAPRRPRAFAGDGTLVLPHTAMADQPR